MNKVFFVALLGLLCISCGVKRLTPENFAKVLKRQDVNKDSVIQKREAMGYLSKNFAWIDGNSDEELTKDELETAANLSEEEEAEKAATVKKEAISGGGKKKKGKKGGKGGKGGKKGGGGFGGGGGRGNNGGFGGGGGGRNRF